MPFAALHMATPALRQPAGAAQALAPSQRALNPASQRAFTPAFTPDSRGLGLRSQGRRAGVLAPVRATSDTVESVRVWYLEQAESPLFLAVEAALGLGLLALFDGGFSGDWSKYGLVTPEQQESLRQAAIVGVIVHTGFGVFAASVAATLEENVALAAVRGFMCGTPEALRNLARRQS